MSTTSKTVLIVGGVAVGAFLLARAMAPKQNTTSFSLFGSGSGAGVAQGVFSAIGGLVSKFTAKTPASSTTPGLPAGFDASNYSVENNSFYTDANGNFVVG